MIIDITIRLTSFLIYVFLLNFFFSDGSSNIGIPLKHALFILLLMVIIALNTSIFPESIESIINIMVTIALIAIIAKQQHIPTKELLFLIVIFLTIDFICETLSVSLFESLLSSQYGSTSYFFEIMTTGITMAVEISLVVGAKLLFFKNRTYYQSLTIPALFALSSIPLISIIILFSFLLSKLNIEIQNNYFELFVVFGILYMNICILYLYNNLASHLRKINQITLQNNALRAEKKYITEIKRSQEKIQSIRHDLKNRYLVVLGLLAQHDVNAATNYLNQSLNSVSSHRVVYSGDSVLNYLLNEKLKVAQKNHTQFNIKVFVSPNIEIENDIFAILIGNLVDNSLEATSRLSDEKRRSISLVIKQISKNLLIDISNTYDPKEKITRAKRQYDGLGTNNVKNIVNNYHGIYKQWAQGSTYYVDVALFNVAHNK